MQKKNGACSYLNEPFKTAVTLKEMINLKYEIDKKNHTNKEREFETKKNIYAEQSIWMRFNKIKIKWEREKA